MEIKKKLNNHNNMLITLSDKTNGTTYSRNGESFHDKKTNMFITEMKLNNPRPENLRKFVISIRKDGAYLNEGEYKMTQMTFDEDNLEELRDCIDEMLIYKNKKKEEYKSLSEQNFEPLVGKRFNIVYKTRLKEVIDELPLKYSKISYIEGNLENFNPNTGVVLYDKEYGFNIIPLKSIVQMKQIMDEE